MVSQLTISAFLLLAIACTVRADLNVNCQPCILNPCAFPAAPGQCAGVPVAPPSPALPIMQQVFGSLNTMLTNINAIAPSPAVQIVAQVFGDLGGMMKNIFGIGRKRRHAARIERDTPEPAKVPKELKVLQDASQKVAEKSADAQVTALKEAAATSGGELKAKVEKVVEAQAKVHEEVKIATNKLVEGKSEEAKKAGQDIVAIVLDGKLAPEEKAKKVEEQVKALPENVKKELDLKPVEQIKQAAVLATNVLGTVGLNAAPKEVSASDAAVADAKATVGQKSVDVLKVATAEVAEKSAQEQEKTLKAVAEKEGGEMKEKVEKVLEAKTKVQEDVKSVTNKLLEGKSEDAQKAGQQIMATVLDEKLAPEEKKAKVADFVGGLSDQVKLELKLKPVEQIKEAAAHATNVLATAGLSAVPKTN